jgi:CRP/FNR family cyclic AMP-dependent transcriptional regulator
MKNEAALHAVLEFCEGLPEVGVKAGDVLLEEGQSTGRMYILRQGAIEILRGGETVAAIDEPGAIFGEMSALLGVSHTATVRAATDALVYRIDDSRQLMSLHPEIVFHVAVILARRLQDSTIYLTDYKRTFSGNPDHFPLVDEVLDALTERQLARMSAKSKLRGPRTPKA